MGKESKKKRSTAAAAPRQQRANSGSNSSTAAASNNSSRKAAAVAADALCTVSLSEEIVEPIAEFDIHAWDARFPFFAEKTWDPMAQELDAAHEIFLKGIQLTETSENLPLAALHIASAFLRDDRVLILVGFEAEKALNIQALCNVLLESTALAVASEQESRLSYLPLGIMTLINVLTELASKRDTRADQSTTACAMKCLCDMLEIPEDILKKTELGKLGRLTHAKVYFLRGRLYERMFNGKSALRDWSKALQLDSSLAVARRARLHLWMVTKTKTQAELHDECLTFLGLVHDDYSESDVIYAILAFSVHSDYCLGKYADVMEYYRKSLQATERRVELYGPRCVPDDIILHLRGALKLTYEAPCAETAHKRHAIDNLMAQTEAMNPGRDEFLEQHHAVDKTKRNKCLNCQKHEGHEGIQLSKCGRCKQVYYCSKECLHANWKHHKVFCNMISEHTTPQREAAAGPMGGDRNE